MNDLPAHLDRRNGRGAPPVGPRRRQADASHPLAEPDAAEPLLAVAGDTLVQRLRGQAQRHPTRTIFRFLGDEDGDERCVDYAELDRRARVVGAQLQAAGAAGARALILHVPGFDYVAALLGCFYAGVVAVPAYPPRNRGLDRLRAIVEDAGVRFVLAGGPAIERLAGRLAREAPLADLQWLATDQADAAGAERWQPPTLEPASVALLQYTSGSTSLPKGVCLTHGNFLDNIDALARLGSTAGEDRIVSWLPPFHDMGLVCGVLMPACTGIESTLMSPAAFLRRPMRWLAAIARHGGTISGGPNFAFELCVRRQPDPEQLAALDLSAWRVAFCGAERVRADTMARFAAAFAPAGFRREALTPCYGLAEATVAVTFGALGRGTRELALDERALGQGRVAPATSDGPAQTLVGCGRPLGGCELLIVDPQTRCRQPDDRIGEIWVRSPSVGAGYWTSREPAGALGAAAAERVRLDTAVFHARVEGDRDAAAREYLRTGDLGFLRGGELFVAGRLKDLIVLRGVNIFPEDIEATVLACDARLEVGRGAAFAVELAGEERLVVVQELDAPRADRADAIAVAIREAIADAHEIAVHDVVLVARGAVPLTSSGKVQRGVCRERYGAGQLPVLGRAGAAPDAARAAPEELVARVGSLMADLLGMRGVGPDDDFFWLGGHSLLATQLVSRLHRAFDVDLPLRVVFEAPTAARLAARIAATPVLARQVPIARVDRDRPLVLSFSQERMWLLHHLDPASAAYNVAGGVILEGSLDPAALHRALDEVVQRHEVLRTNYPSVDGQPQVRIAARRELALPQIDVSGAPAPDDEAMGRAAALARQPFDIAVDPLLRVALYRIGPQSHLLAACMHHLVTDAWSVGLLVDDLLRCYDGFAAGRTPPCLDPAAAAISYVDYAAWQRRTLTDAALAGQLEYWKRQLDGARALELPSDRPRSARRSGAGAFQPLHLPEQLVNGLTAFGVAQGTTLFMVLLAGFEVLLHRYTGSADLVVGIPVANRNRLESETLMGSLVNTLALRLRLGAAGAEPGFRSVLGQVRELALDAYAHQDLPFERLVSALPVERRPGESPIVSVLFDYQNAPVPGRSEGPLRVRPVVLSRGAAQFDLSLLVFDAELGRSAGFEYSTELFDADSMRRMAGHFLAVLETVLLDPDMPISRIPLVDGAERAALLALAAPDRTVRPPPQPLLRAFAQSVAATPQAPALVDERGVLSYAALDDEVAALAARLDALGVAPGTRVAVCLERDRRLVAALLAVLRLGAAYVPLDPRHPAGRLAHVLQDAAPGVLITTRAGFEQLAAGVVAGTTAGSAAGSATAAASAVADAVADAAADATALPPVPLFIEEPPGRLASPVRNDTLLPGHAPAYVLYTSGSAGRPKGVEISRTALDNFLRSMRREPGLGATDRVLAVTTIAFDIAGLELWLPLVCGACVRLAPAEVATDGPALLRLMRAWQPTLMQATPATWKLLLEAGWDGDPQLTVLCGGEAFPADLAQALVERCAAVWNMYGPTETTIWSTLYRVRGREARVPIGKPIDATQVYVLDRHGALQPQGVAGELYIGGAGVAEGYFRRPDLTAERFVADPYSRTPGGRMYRTGDAGRLRADGQLECLARLDDQIKLRGYRIEPGEIEAVLKDAAHVAEAVVQAIPGPSGEPRLVAYVVPVCASAVPGSAQLLERLQRHLPSYMIPSAFVALAELPRTPNGKIDRRRLPAPLLERDQTPRTLIAPRDDLEAALLRIWESVLGTSNIGMRDSFFELGGHSLLAVRIFARIEKQLGVELPLATLFERPTIEYLAERLRAGEAPGVPAAPAAPGATPLPAAVAGGPARPAAQPCAPPLAQPFEFLLPIQAAGTRPPLFCVHGAGGHVFNFAALARCLGSDQPLFGFQARGTDGQATPMAAIATMAEAYVAEMRRQQPQGPYYLGGYCGGGVIAFEMAQQLRAAGQPVALLALIDCYRPGVQTPTPRWQRWGQGVRKEGVSYLLRKAGVWYRRNRDLLRQQLRVTACRAAGRTVPFELRDFWLTRSFELAAHRFVPMVYPGRMIILRATEVDPELLGVGADLGWTGYAAGGIASFDVPGDHYSLLQEPNIRVLGAALKDCLVTAERTAGRDLGT